MFDMLSSEGEPKFNKDLTDAFKRSDPNARLTNIIWSSLTDIIESEILSRSKRVTSGMEVNVMFKGLNRLWKLKPTWFSSSKVL